MLSKHMYSKCAHFKPVAVELKCKWMKKHSLPRKSAGSGEWCPVVPWRDERDLQLCSLQSLSRDQWAPVGQHCTGTMGTPVWPLARLVLVLARLVLIKLNQDPAAAESEEQGRAPRPDPSS